MKLKEIVQALETYSPLHLQESYDNSGLIIGDPEAEIDSALIALDVTPEVIDEAMKHHCRLIISHHPMIFKGVKRITGKTPTEQMISRCIKNEIAVYAAHTNLDNMHTGVNRMICDKIGLQNLSILEPKTGMLRKLVTFCPDEHAAKVRQAIFEAGAGHIGDYDSCSFSLTGQGSFRALDGANPFVGNLNQLHVENEQRIETIFPVYRQAAILKALFNAHPYEEVACDIYPLENEFDKVGAGMMGELPEPEHAGDLLIRLRQVFKTGCIRHTRILERTVSKIAVCGGSGSFLLPAAIKAGADVFVTADVKYHEFFDAHGKILLADPGHYESEQFTCELIKNVLSEKIPNFAAHISKVITNPVAYL